MVRTQSLPTSARSPIHWAGQGRELLLHIVLLTIGAAYIFPFIWMLGSALKTDREFFSQGLNPFPAGEPQWGNFERAWVQANFSQYFFNTLFIAVMTALLTVVFASMTAYALAKLELPGKRFLIAIVGVVFLLPQGYTIIPTFEIIMKLQLLNTLWAVIVIIVTGNLLFSSFMFYGFMRTIPPELEEAAIIDGAAVWQRYLYIALPMTRPMIGTLGLFLFLKGWNEFFLSLVFTLGNTSLRTLSVGMYSFVGMNSREWTLVCAGAAISIVPLIVLFLFLQRYFVAAFAGAVKS
jgi:ABC-type glycerol-3-phosphate transport system permease component